MFSTCPIENILYWWFTRFIYRIWRSFLLGAKRRTLQKTSLLDPGVFLAYLLYRADGKKNSGDFRFYVVYKKNECMQVEKYFTTYILMNEWLQFDEWMTVVWWMNYCSLMDEWLHFYEGMISVWWMNDGSLMNFTAVWWINNCSVMNELLQFDELMNAVLMNDCSLMNELLDVSRINECSFMNEWLQYDNF